MMRRGRLATSRLATSRLAISRLAIIVVGTALAGLPSMQAHAWSEATHQGLTKDALSSVKWIDQYGKLKVTPFKKMLGDVLGEAKPVSAGAFRFKGAKTRQQKRDKYLAQTSGLSGATKRFAQHLLLSDQLEITYPLGEQGKAVSARRVLSGYSGEPDWGMDKGLDASKHQKLMGGTDRKMTSSQGFRHMSFLLGKMGDAPQRAQLFFDLGAKAMEKGHTYWGFRFAAWGLHYLEDMGTPVHTNMLPTSKYIRLKGMLRPRGKDGKRKLNKGFLADLVRGSAQINANYHFLYEHFVDTNYTGKNRKQMSAAVRGKGKKRGKLGTWLANVLAPKTVEKVAKRRAWSRLSTPGIARRAITYFTAKWRQPEAGAADNSVRSVSKESVQQAIATADHRQPNESRRVYRQRIVARNLMIKSTVRQFRKNGVAVRRAMHLLGRRVGKVK